MMVGKWSQALVLVIATAGILAFYIINRRQGMDVLPAVALACALVDAQGNVVASYRYDAWGNILEASGPLAQVNPYR